MHVHTFIYKCHIYLLRKKLESIPLDCLLGWNLRSSDINILLHILQIIYLFAFVFVFLTMTMFITLKYKYNHSFNLLTLLAVKDL